MNTIQLAWHQAKKDIRHHWEALLIFVLLIAGFNTILFALGGRASSSLDESYQFLQMGDRVFMVSGCISVLFIYKLIKADEVFGSRELHCTRPIGGTSVALGKLTVVGIFLVAIPACADGALAVSLGLATDLPILFPMLIAVRLLIAGCALAIAAVCRSLFGFVLTIVGLAIYTIIIGNWDVAGIAGEFVRHGMAGSGNFFVCILAGITGSTLLLMAYRYRNQKLLKSIILITLLAVPPVLIVGRFFLKPISETFAPQIGNVIYFTQTSSGKAWKGSIDIKPPISDYRSDVSFVSDAVSRTYKRDVKGRREISAQDSRDSTARQLNWAAARYVANLENVQVRDSHQGRDIHNWWELFEGRGIFPSSEEPPFEASVDTLSLGFSHEVAAELPLMMGSSWEDGGNSVEVVSFHHEDELLEIYWKETTVVSWEREDHFSERFGAWDIVLINRSAGDVIPLHVYRFRNRHRDLTFWPDFNERGINFSLEQALPGVPASGYGDWVKGASLLVVRRSFVDSFWSRQKVELSFSDSSLPKLVE